MMTLIEKRKEKKVEMIKFCYLDCENSTKEILIYREDHRLRRGTCSVRIIRNLARKCVENGYNSD